MIYRIFAWLERYEYIKKMPRHSCPLCEKINGCNGLF